MKKLDVLLILFYLVVSLGLGYMFTVDDVVDNKIVEISVDNQLHRSYSLPLKEPVEITLDQLGHNVIRIEGDEVWIVEADCPDQICVHDGKKSKSGDLLVCLPNKVVIEIKGQNEAAVDGVTY